MYYFHLTRTEGIYTFFWFLMNSEYLYCVGLSMYHDNGSRFIGHQTVIVAYCPEWQEGCLRNISIVESGVSYHQDVT
jgi:hypothetical protein